MTPTTAFARLALLATLAGLTLLSGCRVHSRRVDVEEVKRPAATTRLTVPVKAHLATGAVVLFRDGATVTADSVIGSGVRYELTLLDSSRVAGIELDSVAALESFSPALNKTESTVLSTAATAATVGATAVAGAALFKALFGSCPTVYADSAGVDALQAELFSYSIAPLFEMRDVDEVRTIGDDSGRVTLTIRNEALETHYINHLELLEVALEPGERMVPDEDGRPILMASDPAPPGRATDRSGRDVTAALARIDGVEFTASPERLAAAVAGDFGEAIELVFPAPSADSVGLVFRVRNSLLNTILLYDIMLGAGAPAVQWLGGDLEEIGRAAELGRWYSAVMGIRISVRDAGEWKEVGRIPDVGPIAWKDVAVTFSPPPGRDLRVRLDFLSDGYRLDAVGLAERVRRGTSRSIAVAGVRAKDGAAQAGVVDALREPDGDYLITGPGDRFDVTFEAGPAAGPRALLLGSQGYYIEWVRGDWVRQPVVARGFEPGDAALRAMYRHWLDVRDGFEIEFERHRVPTP